MITITLNTPLPTDTGEMISSCIVLLESYDVQENIDALDAIAAIQMYRTIENAVDRFRPIWLVEIPIVLSIIRTTLTSGQYANLDLGAVQNALANILEDGDSAGAWEDSWGTWGGLKAKDALNTAIKTMPTSPDAPPTGFSATLNGGKADLVWTEASTNEFGFIVERSLTTITGFEEIARVGYGVEAYSDIYEVLVPPLPGIEYFYRVAAWNNAGLSAYTAEDSVITE